MGPGKGLPGLAESWSDRISRSGANSNKIKLELIMSLAARLNFIAVCT